MYCEHCGAAINAEAHFCSACGGKIQPSGISQPTAQRDFASDRRRGSSQSLRTIILISIPVLLLIVAGFWFTSGSLTRPGAVGKKNASAAPDDVTRSAIKSIEDGYRRLGGKSSLDHVRITNIGPSPLTGADRANGITEKWCVLVNYAYRYETRPWEDHHSAILVVRDQDALKPRMLPTYGGGESAATHNFVRCLSGDIVL